VSLLISQLLPAEGHLDLGPHRISRPSVAPGTNQGTNLERRGPDHRRQPQPSKAPIGKKMATIVDVSGQKFWLSPEKLKIIEVGRTYEAEVTEDGRFRKVEKIAPARAQSPPLMPSTDHPTGGGRVRRPRSRRPHRQRRDQRRPDRQDHRSPTRNLAGERSRCVQGGCWAMDK
jgi:hypothetical protein